MSKGADGSLYLPIRPILRVAEDKVSYSPNPGATGIVEKRLILVTATYEKNEEKIQLGLQGSGWLRSVQIKRNAAGVVCPV